MLLTGIMEEKPEMRAGILDAVFPPEYREKAQGISIEFAVLTHLHPFGSLAPVTVQLCFPVVPTCSVAATRLVHGLHAS